MLFYVEDALLGIFCFWEQQREHGVANLTCVPHSEVHV